MSAPAAERHRTDVRRIADRCGPGPLTDAVGPAVLALLALVTGSRWAHAPRSRILPLLQALVPAASTATWIVVLVAVATRRRRLAKAAGALAAVHAALAAPRLRRHRRAVDDGDRLVVLSSNLRFGHGDPATIVDAVKTRDVDLLLLVEVTVEAHAALLDAGIAALLPHALGQPRADARAVMIHSRTPLRQAEVPPLPSLGYGAELGAVVRPSGDVVVAVVHPVTPVGGEARMWHRELDGIARWAAATPRHAPVVLGGDFNATLDHPVLRRLGDAGFVDAHRRAGRGRRATWPRVPGLSWLTPVFQIDHLQVRGVGVVSAGTLVIPGSDHLAVWAELASTDR